jgi:protein-disulfide isomerase
MEEKNIENNLINGGKSNSQKQIAGAIVLAGLIIAGAILLKDGQPVTVNDTAKNNNIIKIDIPPVSLEEHILGNLDAPIVIVEYSDTECPFCKSFHNTMHNVVAQNSDRVTWVFRHYPIPSLHPKAFYEAEATECAWEQGGNDAFWKYIDEMFVRTESNNKLEVAELPKIAKSVGLNTTIFNSCLASGKYKNKVQSMIDEKNKTGQIGTPYSVIITKKDISTKVQNEILTAIGNPNAVSFSSANKKVMSLNGALPINMVDIIISALLK